MKQSNFITRLISVIFALFIVTYMGYQVWRTLYKPVQTVSAVYIETENTIELTGLVVRDEEVINSADTSIMELTAERGERVAKGDMLAVIYKNEKALEESKKSAELSGRLKRLQTLYEQSGSVYDLDYALSEVYGQCRTLLSNIEGMRFDGFDRSIEDLKMKTLSREYIYRDKSELETLIKDIKQQIKALDISTGSIKKRVYSPSSGYFASEADGFEGSIDSKKIMEITPGEFTALIEADTVKGSKNTGIGKIIKDYVWYFAAVTDASKADLFKNLKTVTLKSSNRFYPDVTAKIARISEADDGTTLVVFRIDEHVSEFSSVRKLSTQVVLNTYKGLKVPREALRVDSDGIQGVYCLMDSQARFKKVNVIFEKDSYYIVDYDTANKDSLLLYDQIIISSKDMEHGKVLK